MSFKSKPLRSTFQREWDSWSTEEKLDYMKKYNTFLEEELKIGYTITKAQHRRLMKYLEDLLCGDTAKYGRSDYADRLKAFIWELEERVDK